MLRKLEKVGRLMTDVKLRSLHVVGCVFLALIAMLVLVQANVRYTLRPENLELLPKETLKELKSMEPDIEGKTFLNGKEFKTLLIYEDGDPQSVKARQLWEPVLRQMKVSFDICEVSDFDGYMLTSYDKVLVAVTKYPKLSYRIDDLKNWVKSGGNLMIAYPPDPTGSFKSLGGILGVNDSGEAVVIEGLRFSEGFMIGGDKHDYMIIDPYESALSFSLTDDCNIYMESTDDYPVPLIWRRTVGEGTVVMDNFGILDKAYRGIHSSAYSLLGDYCAYPVINGASFFIDDFPSPVPEGDSIYINRDYHMSVSDFYSQIWWRDIYNLGQKYGIRYTGLVIEDYSNQVKGEFKRNTEVERFRYFGNMLIALGGEVGIHGYNHMPLVLTNFDYKDQYDAYVQWRSVSDMKNSLEEVFGFTKELFPKEQFQVYVPPSNVLSKEGRELLADTSIRTIGAVYLPTDMAYEQEFDVSEDGIVNTPRITSGCVIDEYMEMAALSELNFHLVNTHFHHPDDVLDEDRGAALGWKQLYSNLTAYFQWLYESFPDIRNLTGSEMAAAVQNYDLVTVEQNFTEDKISFTFGNFNREAWIMVRLNEGDKITEVRGGGASEITGDLYLIRCDKDTVEVCLEKKNDSLTGHPEVSSSDKQIAGVSGITV